MTTMHDYRQSHQRKGLDYHRTFEEMPHRRMVWEFEQATLLRILRAEFAGNSPSHLDFATGTGRVLELLSPHVASSTGADISESMLAVARENTPGARIVHGDITREEMLKDETFDLITAFRFFPNAEEELRQEVIRELVARLSPDGCLVFNNHMNSRSLLHRLSRLRRGVTHETGMTDDEVVDLVEQAGLRITRRYPIAVGPFSENRMRFPRLIRGIESVLMKIPGVTGIARNVVYVCRHRTEPA